jgi:REP element-mobilizing transposase RayT
LVAGERDSFSIFEVTNMSQSLAQIYVHLVFSTKHRRPYLQDPAIREELHRYPGGICNKLECPALRVGGVADHVHLLCRLGRSISIANLVKELKRASSLWLKIASPDLKGFHWQSGYGAFSISPSHVESVREYIGRQDEHHRTETFQDEFLRLLKKYALDYDARYIWD